MTKTVIHKLTPKHIDYMQLAAIDPMYGSVFAVAHSIDLMSWEEFNQATALDWCDPSYLECKQIMACFILLSLNIELEV